MAIDVIAELKAGAIYTDRHFIYTSGKHGSAYINSDPMFPHVQMVSELCDQLIEPFVGQVDTVAAPATGGIVLGVLSALAFNKQVEKVAGVWADKSGSEFVFERAGFIEQIKASACLLSKTY